MTVIPRIPLDEARSMEDIMSAILADRGLKNEKEIDTFLHPPAPTLDYLIKNAGIPEKSLKKMAQLVGDAMKRGEDILVFGDYDADGVTATTVMWRTLSSMAQATSARVLPFIPDRVRHGYGLSEAAVQEIEDGTAWKGTAHEDFAPKLVITVDNGIVANSAVSLLKGKGVTVVITDHHLPEKIAPPADCIVHTTTTSGAGIAWIVTMYLDHESFVAKSLIDIATIGIIADMIPLTGVNRAIVAMGLRALSRPSHPGLKSLYEQSGLTGKEMTTYDVSFGIAPRLNAAGRLASPLEALRLLCTTSDGSAEKLASAIEGHNKLRQELTESAIERALSGRFSHNIVVLASDEYHEGVIGLVAGKVMEKVNKPVIVISIRGEIAKGSARSLPGIDITKLLRQVSGIFTGLGGHAGAAGFSLRASDIPRLKRALYEIADNTIDKEHLVKRLVADIEVVPRQVTLSLAHALHRLEPYGMGNQKPRFLLKNVHVLEDRKVGKTGNHRKLVIENDGITKDVIWFNGEATHPLSAIKELVGTVEVNVWRDRENVQLVAQYVEV